MLSVAVFWVSLAGLVTLFGCKAFELAKNVRTPLERIRRIGDPLVRDSWARSVAACRRLSCVAVQASESWCVIAAQRTRVSLDRALHALAARLNRYLRGRRVEMRVNGEPSARLKTVLQKEENTTPPSSL